MIGVSIFSNLANGIVVENTLHSWTGDLLYSDTGYDQFQSIYPQNSVLDHLASKPFIGILGGIIRVALAAFHILVHTLSLIFTFDFRHFMHIAKGGCELLKGIIQSIPIIGHWFSHSWLHEWKGAWWMIKIYNPNKPDSLDEYSRNFDPHQDYWNALKTSRPSAYICS